MTTTVTTQAELDKAIDAGKTDIIIDSPAGVWLTLRGSSRVVAWGSSRVEARGSSRVEARGSSRVEARGSSRVEAWGSSRVVASDSSRVEAWGSSRVEAWDSSRVVASDSSRVVASDSSRVEAWGSSRVEASRYVAVHLHSKRATITGGVVIDLTDINLERVADFIDYRGVTVRDGMAVLYKAVDNDLNAGHSYRLTNYPIGGEVVASDWEASQKCGNGLHLGYTPSAARSYFSGATRFLECETPVEGLVALGDKVKCESLRVVAEVDVYGDRLVSS